VRRDAAKRVDVELGSGLQALAPQAQLSVGSGAQHTSREGAQSVHSCCVSVDDTDAVAALEHEQVATRRARKESIRVGQHPREARERLGLDGVASAAEYTTPLDKGRGC